MYEEIQPLDLREKLVVKSVRNIRRSDGMREDPGKSMYRPGVVMDLQRSRLMTQSYKETEGEAMVIRRAKAFAAVMTGLDPCIQDWEKIVGNNVSTPQGLFFAIDMNWRSVQRFVNSEEGRSLLDDKGRQELDEMAAYWKGKSMSDRQQSMFSGDVLKYWNDDVGSAADWSHWSDLGIPDYEKVFRVGLRGLIEEAQERLKKIDRDVPHNYVDQKDFLTAVIISLEAVIQRAHLFAHMAREKAALTSDPAHRKRLEDIAQRCDKVPEHPPETLAEALQSFFFVHVARNLEFSSLGIGVRFDKVFGPYYENDLKNGRTTREEALELLQMLWVKFHDLGLVFSPRLSAIYGGVILLQAMVIGGVDENGKDVTNDMTYLVLETAEYMRTPEPTLALRYHDGTPDELLSKAIDVVRTGIGYPSFFNDNAILPLLEKWDVPLKDARDYAVSGCVYLEIPGKNVSRKAVGGLNMPLALWYALHQGVNGKTGEQTGARTPDPRTFESIDDVMDAYCEQVLYFMRHLLKVHNTTTHLYEKYLPRPFYSALLEGCIEKGMESKQWEYPSPVANLCIMLGPTNAADGMTAIKKLVFEDKKITMDQLITAIDHDWVGYEDIRQMVLNAPKYGNDDDYADQMAQQVHYRTVAEMAKCKTRHGNRVRGDGSGISATYGRGAQTPATPDGRKARAPLSDATLSPGFGMDKSGPTAVLKSASKIDTTKTYNHLLNQKFMPDCLEGDFKNLFVAYLRSWGDLNISHAQFNVVDNKTLIHAKKHPEDHMDLLVRVAGYSAYFVDLSDGLQDSIIARSVHSF
jgi:formate C-acetyltransferase